jgi:hypothetical protein
LVKVISFCRGITSHPQRLEGTARRAPTIK